MEQKMLGYALNGVDMRGRNVTVSFFGSNDDADGLDGSGSPKGSNHGVHRDTGKGNS
jgi:hypothetical protein